MAKRTGKRGKPVEASGRSLDSARAPSAVPPAEESGARPQPRQSASPKTAPAPSASAPAEGPASFLSPKGSLVALGTCALLALSIVAASWPGYRIKVATRRAETAVAAGRHADAIPDLERIVAKYPDAVDRLSQLADCYLEAGRPKEALDTYDKALALDPARDFDAKRGRAHYLLKDYDKAIALLRGAIDADPLDPYANLYIGLFYMDEDPEKNKKKDPAKAAFFFLGATAKPETFERARPHIESIRRELLGG